jgi:hypothetical protein
MNNAKEKQWLSNLTVKSNATSLVRDTLGCTCPREIFDHYQVGSHISGDTPMVQLIMGSLYESLTPPVLLNHKKRPWNY